MEPVKAVVDTNILIDFLTGSLKARRELESFDEIYISLVSWMEVLASATDEEEPEIREFLRRFRVHDVDQGVAERAVDIRRREKIRLPDAIIWATAQHLGMMLVTRNTRDFPAKHPGIRVPYRV